MKYFCIVRAVLAIRNKNPKAFEMTLKRDIARELVKESAKSLNFAGVTSQSSLPSVCCAGNIRFCLSLKLDHEFCGKIHVFEVHTPLSPVAPMLNLRGALPWNTIYWCRVLTFRGISVPSAFLEPRSFVFPSFPVSRHTTTSRINDPIVSQVRARLVHIEVLKLVQICLEQTLQSYRL